MIDTSRVALTLARARIMGAKFPSYLLLDSKDGQEKESMIQRKSLPHSEAHHDIRQGFVYDRIPHITLKSIADNIEIDVIWERFRTKSHRVLSELNTLLGTDWSEWEVPKLPGVGWSAKAIDTHARWWQLCMERQEEVDASIRAKADCQYLYDRPYINSDRVRVAGSFTVESVSPHRMLAIDENDEFFGVRTDSRVDHHAPRDFVTIILENLRDSGIQQSHKEGRVSFTTVVPWPGRYICAVGQIDQEHQVADDQSQAAILIGPEFGTVSRPDMIAAAREAAEGSFDMLVACAFSFDPHVSDLNSFGPIPILKARMNADLHMAEDLRNTGKGNLFVVFGEPDINVLTPEGEDPNTGRIFVRINGIDVYDPNSGEIRSRDIDGIACWFIDTDYNEESFFVRQAYFLGKHDPYKALKNTLRSEINQHAWRSLNSEISRPFSRPASGRIAVKAINCFGDEVMRVIHVAPPT